MCFEFDARPPALPADLVRPVVAGGAAAELLELTSADGTVFSAALAEVPWDRETGVVILPDVRGLYTFYIELAERFSQAGYPAIALDYYGRTAGLGPRDEDFDYTPHREQTKISQVQEDMASAVAALRERSGVRSIASVGFCFGGMQSLMAGMNPDLELAAVVSFYGILDGQRWGLDGPLQRAEEIGCPVLGLYGGADKAIPVDDVREFEQRVAAAGIPHEIKVYDGAPHSFFDRSFEEHAEASEDAWRRMLRFLERIEAPAGVAD